MYSYMTLVRMLSKTPHVVFVSYFSKSRKFVNGLVGKLFRSEETEEMEVIQVGVPLDGNEGSGQLWNEDQDVRMSSAEPVMMEVGVDESMGSVAVVRRPMSVGSSLGYLLGTSEDSDMAQEDQEKDIQATIQKASPGIVLHFIHICEC